MMLRTIVACFVVWELLTGLLSAQTSPSKTPLSVLLFSPEDVLRSRTKLNLTDMQAEAVRREYETALPKYRERQAAAETAALALRAALAEVSPPEDTAQLYVTLLDAERQVKELEFTVMLAVRRILTPQQFVQARTLAAAGESNVTAEVRKRVGRKLDELRRLTEALEKQGAIPKDLEPKLRRLQRLVREGRAAEAETLVDELLRSLASDASSPAPAPQDGGDLRRRVEQIGTAAAKVNTRAERTALTRLLDEAKQAATQGDRSAAERLVTDIEKRLPVIEEQISIEAITPASNSLGAALIAEDSVAILKAVSVGVQALGNRARVPEVPDRYQIPPTAVEPLSSAEVDVCFRRLLGFIRDQKWWRIGLDPTKTEHLPREAAACIVALTAGVRANASEKDAMLKEAKEAADYLIWTQTQGGRGVFPFPYFRGGRNKAFQAADRFISAAERAGRLPELLHEGWMIDDTHDGGLQFDNGLCGVALLELYQVCGDEKYLRSVQAAADWAIARPLATNWNYNSFSVYLLARAFAVTNEGRYRAAATKKALLGVTPGQLVDGPHRGRWCDQHNARPAYHYIMIRSLVALLGVLSADDPARAPLVESTRSALTCRNREFTTQGIMNVDSSLEALLLTASSPPEVRESLRDCDTKPALAVLERHVVSELRRNRGPAGPGQIGRYLEYVRRSGK